MGRKAGNCRNRFNHQEDPIMKTIVALVDFTDVSFKILKLAHTLAKGFDSHVILLHVVPPEPAVVPAIASLGAEATPIIQGAMEETIQLGAARLAELESSLKKFGVNATSMQLEGSVAETVMAEVPRLKADLLIMGSHHHGAIYNFLVGSVTAAVLKQAAYPVLVVPADAPEQEGKAES